MTLDAIGVSGTIFGWGDHVCALHRGPVERDRVLTDFFTPGLVAGENCVYVADHALPAAVTARAEAAGDGPRVVVAPAQKTYFPERRFDPGVTVAVWNERLDELGRSGAPGTRAAADMSWARSGAPGVERLNEYEAALNESFFNRHPVVGLCLYDLDDFQVDVLPDLLRTHPRLLVDGVVLDNPSYEGPPGKPAGVTDPATTLAALRLLGVLLARATSFDEAERIAVAAVPALSGADLIAVVRVDSGRRRVRGALDGLPIPDDLAARLTRAASRADGEGDQLDWLTPGLRWSSVHAVRSGGHVLGYLVAGGRDAVAWADGVRTLLDDVALRLGAALVSAQLRGDLVNERDRAALAQRRQAFDDLLTGMPPGVAEGTDLAALTGRGGPVRVVVTTGFRRTDLLALLAPWGVSLATLHQGDVVLLAPEAAEWDTLRGALADAADDPALHLGVGGAIVDAEGVTRSFAEARQALGLARSAGRAVARFEDLGILRLLLSGADAAGVASFVEEWLAALNDYDARHDAGLVATLEALFDRGGNQLAASGLLGIHISTFKYRLRRIHEISGLDLSDPEVKFHLQLAVRAERALEMLGGTTSG